LILKTMGTKIKETTFEVKEIASEMKETRIWEQ
jgi:hypothetical protein